MPPAIFQSNEIVSDIEDWWLSTGYPRNVPETYIHIVFLDHLGYKPVTSSFYSILLFSCVVCLCFIFLCFLFVLFNYVSCLCFFLVVSFLVFFIFVHVFVLCACITKRVRLFEFKVMCLCLDCSCVLHPLSSSSLCIRIVFLDHSLIKSRHLIFRFVSLYLYRLFRPFTDTE